MQGDDAIYMAGPLFTTGERRFNQDLADALRMLGYEVLLPQEFESRGKTARAIFDKDVDAVRRSGVVLACMDGPDPDSGTCFEVGLGYGLGIPVVTYRTDFRGVGDEGGAPFNLMLTESSQRVLTVSALDGDAAFEILVDLIEDVLTTLGITRKIQA